MYLEMLFIQFQTVSKPIPKSKGPEVSESMDTQRSISAPVTPIVIDEEETDDGEYTLLATIEPLNAAKRMITVWFLFVSISFLNVDPGEGQSNNPLFRKDQGTHEHGLDCQRRRVQVPSLWRISQLCKEARKYNEFVALLWITAPSYTDPLDLAWHLNAKHKNDLVRLRDQIRMQTEMPSLEQLKAAKNADGKGVFCSSDQSWSR
jgi:hypothetical protein